MRLGVFTVILVMLSGACFSYESVAKFISDGNYYTGSTRFSGQTCSSCHTGSRDSFQIGLDAAGLVQNSDTSFFYTPSRSYQITVSLTDDNNPNTLSYDQNGFVMEILKSDGEAAGTLSEVLSTQTANAGRVIMDDDNPGAVVSTWTFSWTAPSQGSGTLTAYFAGVDGDGDNTGNNDAQDYSDTSSITLLESSVTTSPDSGGCGFIGGKSKSYNGGFILLLISMLLLILRNYRLRLVSSVER